MVYPGLKILVWLPSPMGDAILATPALRAIRNKFRDFEVYFFANSIVRGILSPCSLNDHWLEHKSINPLLAAFVLKKHNFTDAFLFKNSFGSALACILARIPRRIGYAREGRSIFLTDRLHPLKLPNGDFEPVSMIDYYLEIAYYEGAEIKSKNPELSLDEEDCRSFYNKFPQLSSNARPLVVFVPGGAFGPSKCWDCSRFAETADELVSKYDAQVVLSVSSHPMEKRIAGRIQQLASNVVLNLSENPVTPGELKCLFSRANLVITNDTGPRHIAIAFDRPVITLFGPNDPAWTETNHKKEIKIIGKAPCAPCAKPECTNSRHICMESITVEMVVNAADKILGGG